MLLTPKTYSHYNLMHEGILALGRAERTGMSIDMDYCRKMDRHLDRQIIHNTKVIEASDLALQWRKRFGTKTNYGSDPQLTTLLYDVMGLKANSFTDKGTPSVGEDALKSLHIPELDTLIELRGLDKAKNTYLAQFMREQVDGVIHPFFNLHIPTTFRSSSDSPNFQNIPNHKEWMKKMIRKAIKARKGKFFLFLDYSGAEVRVAIAYHNDPTMKKYLLGGGDMHKDVAVDSFLLLPAQVTKEIRYTAKNKFTFAQFYGDYWKSCAKGMWNDLLTFRLTLPDGTLLKDHLKFKGIKTLEQFEKHIEKVERIFWDKRFPVYKQWKEDWYEAYLKKGYFDMLSGFRCSDIMSFNDATNYPVQGAAFHCLLLAFVLLDHEQTVRKWESRLVAQIHDELVIETDENEYEEVMDVAIDIMQNKVPEIYPWLNVQMIAEPAITPINGTWYDKMEIEDIVKKSNVDDFLNSLIAA